MTDKLNTSQHMRSYAVDLFRLLLALGIVVYHFNYYALSLSNAWLVPGGYILVETFFVISGYYFARSRAKWRKVSAGEFLRKELKNLWPPYIVALVVAAVVKAAGGEAPHFRDLISEALMAQELPLVHGSHPINNPAWYVSALLAALLLFHALDRTLSSSVYKRVVPLLTFLSIGFMAVVFGTLHVHGVTRVVVAKGIIRAVAGAGTGVLAYRLAQRVDQWPRAIPAIAPLGCLVLAFTCHDSLLDLAVYPLAAMAIIGLDDCALTFEGVPLVTLVGRLSYWLYLLHNSMRILLTQAGCGESLILCLVVTIAAAYVATISEHAIRKNA